MKAKKMYIKTKQIKSFYSKRRPFFRKIIKMGSIKNSVDGIIYNILSAGFFA